MFRPQMLFLYLMLVDMHDRNMLYKIKDERIVFVLTVAASDRPAQQDEITQTKEVLLSI